MKVFSETSVYIVSYWPGTSGTFIQTLLAGLISEYKDIRLSEHGNAHGNFMINSNHKDAEIEGSNIAQYLLIDPINPNKPLFLGEHFPVSYKTVSYKYPKAKIVSIHYNKNDIPMVEANLFYKVYIDDCDNPQNMKHWDEMRNVYFNGIEHPKLVSKELIYNFIHRDSIVCPYYDESIVIDEPNVIKISFSDILFNKNTILGTLSKFIEKPIPDNIVNFYDRYLKKQFEMYKNIGLGINNR